MRVLWALLLLPAVVWASSCDSRCVCYDDVISNLKAANCSNVHYNAKSFSDLLRNVQMLRVHDGNDGIFSHSWSSCHNLQELYVDNNHQTSLNPKTLKNCKRLRVLDLSNNKISKVSQINPLLKELPHLERLVLRGNPITVLPDLASPSLTFLDLSYCNLNIVGERSFAKLRKLHTLSLEGNKLRKFKTTLPPSLRFLNLMLNDIATISPVEHFSKLKILELAGNPIQCSCDLVLLRNEETGDLMASRQETTCAGSKTMLGLSWTRARKHCELNHPSRRQRRDLDDLEEGSGFGAEIDNSEDNANADDEGDDIITDGDNEIEEDDDFDPIVAPTEEKTEQPNSEETKLVDSKLTGTVEEPDEITESHVSNKFIETDDHSTSSTTEREFIPHEENETDDVAKEEQVTGETKVDPDPENDETGNTGSDKHEENVKKEDDDDHGDHNVPENTLPDKSETSEVVGETVTDYKEEEDEDEDDDDDDDENDDLILPVTAIPDKPENEGEAVTDDKRGEDDSDDDDYDDHLVPEKDSDANAGEEETKTDTPETVDKDEENPIINVDKTHSEHEEATKETEEDEEGKDKANEEGKDDDYNDSYDTVIKSKEEDPEESATDNIPVNVRSRVLKINRGHVDEGTHHSSTDETSTSKWEDGMISGSEEDDDEILPIIPPVDDNETNPIVEGTIGKVSVTDVELGKAPGESVTVDEDTDVEGSGGDSEEVTTSMGGVGGDEETSQGTTQPGPDGSQVVTDDAMVTGDTNKKISLESAESPVTSTGSYVVLGLIMVLIVFLLGYAVYKSRLGRRRSDGDSRTIKEKDVELGKGNDRELQDVSKPLLITPPAAEVNGKSELQQPLVSKPSENPQLKDDKDDKKNGSPIPSRYHIYETLNGGDKERIEVPPPTAAAPVTAATIPVSTSPKKSPSPTRAVSKLPPPRDAESPGPNMYGENEDNDDDGEVFLKNTLNGDLGSPRSCRVTVVQGDLSVPKKPVFVVNPGATPTSGLV